MDTGATQTPRVASGYNEGPAVAGPPRCVWSPLTGQCLVVAGRVGAVGLRPGLRLAVVVAEPVRGRRRVPLLPVRRGGVVDAGLPGRLGLRAQLLQVRRLVPLGGLGEIRR